MEDCTCIFQLSIIVFSGSSLGCFIPREGEAANKGIKGQDENSSYIVSSLQHGLWLILCVPVPSAVELRLQWLFPFSYEQPPLFFLLCSHLPYPFPKPFCLLLSDWNWQVSEASLLLWPRQASCHILNNLAWLRSMAYIPETNDFSIKYNHLTLPHPRFASYVL